MDNKTIYNLKLAHASFNFMLFLLFCFQAWLGRKIRTERLAGKPISLNIVKRHRKQGPVFAILGILGFMAGMTLIYLDKGRLLQYPLHFIVGSLIALLLFITFMISRKISSSAPEWRTPHFIIGISLIFLYLIQALLGLSILL